MNETISPGDLALVLVVVGFALLLRFLLTVRRLWDERRSDGGKSFPAFARLALVPNAFGAESEWMRRRASASAGLGAILVAAGLIVAILA